jgi:colicin import membrane protein
MKTVELVVDESTGEIIPQNVSIEVSKPPAIIIDIDDVRLYHSEPEKLIEKIRIQAGYAVFDVSTEKGRAACRSHAANIIKCISPAINASKQMAADAQKIIKRDLAFRKIFETSVREIADYHRKPLTEYEAQQKRLADEQLEREAQRVEAELYELDHQEAIDYDELYTLRKARAMAELSAALIARAEEDKRLFDEAVIREAEALRLKIQHEEQAKAEAAERKKLEAERAMIRAEEQGKAQAKAAAEYHQRYEEQRTARDAARDKEAAEYKRKYLEQEEKRLAQVQLDANRKATQQPAVKADVEMITIPKAEYDELLARSARLAEIEREFS